MLVSSNITRSSELPYLTIRSLQQPYKDSILDFPDSNECALYESVIWYNLRRSCLLLIAWTSTCNISNPSVILNHIYSTSILLISCLTLQTTQHQIQHTHHGETSTTSANRANAASKCHVSILILCACSTDQAVEFMYATTNRFSLHIELRLT